MSKNLKNGCSTPPVLVLAPQLPGSFWAEVWTLTISSKPQRVIEILQGSVQSGWDSGRKVPGVQMKDFAHLLQSSKEASFTSNLQIPVQSFTTLSLSLSLFLLDLTATKRWWPTGGWGISCDCLKHTWVRNQTWPKESCCLVITSHYVHTGHGF